MKTNTLWTEITMDMHRIKKTVQPNPAQIDLMAQIATNAGIIVTQERRHIAQIVGANHAGGFFVTKRWCDIADQDAVILNCDADQDYWYRALLHELAHATGPRLKRFTCPTAMSSGERYWEESVAESTTLKLLHALNLCDKDLRSITRQSLETQLAKAQLYGYDVDMRLLDAQSEDAGAMVLEWIKGTALDYKAVA